MAHRDTQVFLLIFTLMQTAATPLGRQSSAQPRNETGRVHGASDPPMALWTHSQSGAALVLPLASPTSASPLDGYHTSLFAYNVRTDLSDGLARHGYYTTTVYIGTPPQTFALIVDTGSTVTYVPCSSCSHCGAHQVHPAHEGLCAETEYETRVMKRYAAQDASFNPEDSSTYTAIHCDDLDCEMGTCAHNSNFCNYARHYAEQSSSSGLLARDYMRFARGGSGFPRPMLFGCETTESGNLFLQHADGIIGLGRGSLSVVDQLIGQDAIANAFSLCYGGMDEGGGAMVLGALPPVEDMVFTPSNSTRSSYYNVVLKEIWVQGEPLPVKPSEFDGRYGTILDSGTTFAYLPEKAFSVFKDALRSLFEEWRTLKRSMGLMLVSKISATQVQEMT